MKYMRNYMCQNKYLIGVVLTKLPQGVLHESTGGAPSSSSIGGGSIGGGRGRKPSTDPSFTEGNLVSISDNN